jgi:hypothetical protein
MVLGIVTDVAVPVQSLPLYDTEVSSPATQEGGQTNFLSQADMRFLYV